MRQAGIIAAGGLYALKNNVSRLKEDHYHAKELEGALKKMNWVESVVPVETNIVVVILKDYSSRDYLISELENHGVKIIAFGSGMLRFVTHLDISSLDIDKTISVLNKIRV